MVTIYTYRNSPLTNGKLMESDTPFSLYQREWWRADLRRFLNEKSWLALKK